MYYNKVNTYKFDIYINVNNKNINAMKSLK